MATDLTSGGAHSVWSTKEANPPPIVSCTPCSVYAGLSSFYKLQVTVYCCDKKATSNLYKEDNNNALNSCVDLKLQEEPGSDLSVPRFTSDAGNPAGVPLDVQQPSGHIRRLYLKR